MDAIKHIGNVAKVSLVCIGTPPVDNLRKLNFQYFRRFPKIELERFNKIDDELKDVYSLKDDELDYIKSFALKYRMGGEVND